MTRSRRIAFCVVTPFVAVVAAFGLAEGGLRLAALVVPSLAQHQLSELGYRATGHRFLYDPLLGWRNIPGWRSTTFGKPLSINSLGMRGAEVRKDKPPNKKRILVLGDSYVWGLGVGDEEVFPRVLERGLARRDDGAEVLNAGVSGWGTDQQFLYLFSEGIDLAPDLVILAFFVHNDPINNANPFQYGMAKPHFADKRLRVIGVPVPYLGFDADGRYAVVRPRPLCHRTALCDRLVTRTLRAPAWMDALSSLGLVSFAPLSVPKMTVDPIALSLSILRGVAELCHERKTRLLVIKFGAFLRNVEQNQWDTPLRRDAEKQLMVGLRVDVPHAVVLDLDAAYAEQKVSADELTRGGDRWHWNALGHRITARVVEKFIIKNKLLE